METISPFSSSTEWEIINFQIPASWSELSDKQLRTVYQLIADDFSCQREQSSSSFETMPSAAENERSYMSTYELKTLCLLNWSSTSKTFSFQEFTVCIATLQYLHLVNGYLVEFDKPL